jgi:predicted ATPase with chaperone activity
VHRDHAAGPLYHRILKIARTIADLDGAPSLQQKYVSEAIQYRSLGRRIGMLPVARVGEGVG